MANLDLYLALGFGTVTIISLLATVICFRKALRVSGERDGDVKMFLWSVGSLVGLVVAGMSAAYILLPILFTHLK